MVVFADILSVMCSVEKYRKVGIYNGEFPTILASLFGRGEYRYAQGLYPPPAIRLLSIIITRSISILGLIISSALYSLKSFFYLNFIGLFRTSCLSALTPTLLRHHFHHHRHKPHTLHTFGGVETQAKEGIFFQCFKSDLDIC